jgi:hypothetical protein
METRLSDGWIPRVCSRVAGLCDVEIVVQLRRNEMEWTAVFGAALLGFIATEFMGALSKCRVPVAMNLIGMSGFALIAAYMVFK